LFIFCFFFDRFDSGLGKEVYKRRCLRDKIHVPRYLGTAGLEKGVEIDVEEEQRRS